MRPLLVGYSDLDGGAARATYRIHRALRAEGVDSTFFVRKKVSYDPSVRRLRGWGALWRPAATRIESQAHRLQHAPNPMLRSSNLLPTRWSPYLRGDVVHLNWIGAGTLSIGDIGKIPAPTVFTLHDMWGFCGAEHYDRDAPDARWITGYTRHNRPEGHHGLDLDRWTWLRKRRHWSPMEIVAPSRWLADSAAQSFLMADWPTHVVPNPLDPHVFRPRDQAVARRGFGIPPDTTVILFGAPGGRRDPRKGFDLLLDALRRRDPGAATVGVIFGEEQPARPPRTGIPLRWVGQVDDDDVLASLYSAADVMVVPSRQEAFGQTASEAQACGTPVVAFDTTGLADVIDHARTGYLAEPFSAESLARGISYVLDDPGRTTSLGAAARERAVRLWSPSVVARRYLEIYAAAASRYSQL